MAIIISKNGKNAKKIEKSNFEKEDYLQKYIYDNPESIPLHDIKDDIRLLILVREFPTDSGPIDAIGIDIYGNIYLIETKLFKNPDKRTVVAQVLDYGASLWRNFSNFSNFLQNAERETNKNFGIGLNQKIKNFFDIDDDGVSALLDNVEKNLNDGKFKFVVLMDKLHNRLKDLIVFINTNSEFDIYAVEMEYYKLDDREIIIPKIFGAEVKKDIAVSTSSVRGEWDKNKFFQSLENNLNTSQVEKMKEIYNKFEKISDNIRWGTGTTNGSYAPIINSISPTRSILSVYSNGRLSIKFNWFIKDEWKLKETNGYMADKFGKLLLKYAPNLKLPNDYRKHEIKIEPGEWIPFSEGVLKAFEELKN